MWLTTRWFSRLRDAAGCVAFNSRDEPRCLLLGLLRRERRGPAGIGAEGLVILLLYAGVIGLQIWQG